MPRLQWTMRFKEDESWDSLVVQWLGLHLLPLQGTQIRSLVRELTNILHAVQCGQIK